MRRGEGIDERDYDEMPVELCFLSIRWRMMVDGTGLYCSGGGRLRLLLCAICERLFIRIKALVRELLVNEWEIENRSHFYDNPPKQVTGTSRCLSHYQQHLAIDSFVVQIPDSRYPAIHRVHCRLERDLFIVFRVVPFNWQIKTAYY